MRQSALNHMTLSFLMSRVLEIFLCFAVLGFGQTNAVAADVYRLNTGDQLEISVWQEENLKQETVVLPDGSISFPLIGSIVAAGKTTEELASAIRGRLEEFIPSPEVSVRVVNAEGNMIYVIGEVAKPGAFVVKGPTHVMQALSMAGGLTEFAKKNRILILRHEGDGRTKTFPFEYGDVEDGEELESNIVLKSGDTVVVP